MRFPPRSSAVRDNPRKISERGPVILEPDWTQPRPTFADVRAMTLRIDLNRVTLPENPFSDFLGRLRESHSNGGAYIEAFDVLPDNVFDWFASRNRLEEEELIDTLV